MNLSEALELFELDLNNITADSLKKRYRQLVKKNHPDIGGSTEKAQEINEANEILLEALNRVALARVSNQVTNKSQDKRIFVITVEQLIAIYNGKSFKAGGSEPVIIDIKALKKLNILLAINAQLIIDGITFNYDNITPYNTADVYSIECTVNTSNINDNKDITIKCNTKTLNIVLDNDKTIRFKLENNIVITVIIKKRVVDDGKQG